MAHHYLGYFGTCAALAWPPIDAEAGAEESQARGPNWCPAPTAIQQRNQILRGERVAASSNALHRRSVQTPPQTRTVVAVRFVPHIAPRDGIYCEESWSEWQDLNLRPPRPERGILNVNVYRTNSTDFPQVQLSSSRFVLF